MPDLTPNYKFKKPIFAEETADIRVINENFDIADEELKKANDTIKNLGNDKQNKTDSNLLTIAKTIVGAINELFNNKLDKGGYTGTAQNLLTEISKIASKTVLGRMIVGKGLTVDSSSGRTSVVSKNDGIIVNDNDIQLNVYDGVDSTSTTRAGSARAVKMAYDKGVEGLNKADTKLDAGSVSTEYNTAKKIEDKIKEKIDKKAIVNDLTTGGTDNVLSGKMGKYLDENKMGKNDPIYIFTKNRAPTEPAIDTDNVTIPFTFYNTSSTNIPTKYAGSLIDLRNGNGKYGSQLLIDIEDKAFYRSISANRYFPWRELVHTRHKELLGISGVENTTIVYVQDAGLKEKDKCYIDKDTGKLYVAIENTYDVTITEIFFLATNTELARRSKNMFEAVYNYNPGANSSNYNGIIDLSSKDGEIFLIRCAVHIKSTNGYIEPVTFIATKQDNNLKIIVSIQGSGPTYDIILKSHMGQISIESPSQGGTIYGFNQYVVHRLV